LDGIPGKLIVTPASSLLVALEELGVLGLPETPGALARRLSSSSFTDITVLDERRALGTREMRRRAKGRALGIIILAETLSETGDAGEQSFSRNHVLTSHLRGLRPQEPMVYRSSPSVVAAWWLTSLCSTTGQ